MTLNKTTLADAVIAYFMKHGKPCTVKDLAAHLQVSEARIRRIGGPDNRIDWTHVEVPRHEKNYGSVIGFQKADAWHPSRECLRNELSATRQAARDVIEKARALGVEVLSQ